MEFSKERQLRKRTKQKIPMRRRNKIDLNFPQHVKIAIKLRDGRCVNCGSPREMLTAHHFVLKSAYGMGIIENGIALCNKCHTNVHLHDKDFIIRDRLQDYLDEKYPHFSNEMRKYKKYGR